MGFLSKATALALAATACVAAQDFSLDDINTQVEDALAQVDTNGTSWFALIKLSAR